MMYYLIVLKRIIEQFLMYPWIWAGKRYAKQHPLPQDFDIFFFFPIYSIGGAEKVNAEVVKTFSDKKLIIFFTKKSKDSSLLPYFQGSNIEIKDISRFTDNKKRYWDSFFWRGVCSYYINKQQKQPVVFIGQCNFGYKLLPHLKKETRTVELIHNKVWQFAQVVLPYVTFIDCRIMIAEFIKESYLHYYQKLHFPSWLKDRITIIRNGIDIPDFYTEKKQSDQLQILFVGRGSPEKRLPLIFQVIECCAKENRPFHFHLAGDFENEIPADIRPMITWHGLISDNDTMNQLHKNSDVFLLLSVFEGMPVSMMEAMAQGSVPVTTAVGGIPELITHNENGLLITDTEEKDIITKTIDLLDYLYNHPATRKKLSEQAFLYAKKNFSLENFRQNYRAALKL